MNPPKPVEVNAKGKWWPGWLKACQRVEDGSWRAQVNWWEGAARQHLEWRAADLVRPRGSSTATRAMDPRRAFSSGVPGEPQVDSVDTSDEQPTAKQTWVTLRSPRRSSAMARSMRRVIR